jgi:type 1 glutamine amidotransferase
MKRCILILMALAACQAAPIQVMLLDGQSGGPYHDWRATTPVLKKQLEATGLFQVDVVTAPPSNGDFSQFKPDFRKYQVVVSNLDSPDWPTTLMTSFEEYMKGGGGLVVVHAADNAFPNWPAYNLMIGIGGWRGRNEKSGPLWYVKDGKLVSDPSPGNAGSHGARLPYKLTAQDPTHPVLAGLPKVWMHAADELYATLRGPGENMKAIATAHSETTNRGTDRDELILLTTSYGKGRVFHTAMGHDVAALRSVGFIATFQRGTEWAATGKVTQKVPADFPTAEKASVRE